MMKLKIKTVWSDNEREGRTIMFLSSQTLTRMPKVPKSVKQYGSLQHEVFHAVEFVFIGKYMILHSRYK